MTPNEALNAARIALESAGIVGASRDARILLESLDNYRNIFNSNELDSEDIARYFARIERRKSFEPVSHILGYREFWKDRFFVNAHVLDPRPESEVFVETALAIFEQDDALRCLDLGAGSGCLGLSILHELPQATCCFADISPDALHVTKQNAVALGFIERSRFIKSDWLSAVDTRFDLILCNPPYISLEEYKGLEKDVFFEPDIALTDFSDGFEVYRQLAKQIDTYLNPNGIALFEFGIGQEEKLYELFCAHSGCDVSLVEDISGRPRLVKLAKT